MFCDNFLPVVDYRLPHILALQLLHQQCLVLFLLVFASLEILLLDLLASEVDFLAGQVGLHLLDLALAQALVPQ